MKGAKGGPGPRGPKGETVSSHPSYPPARPLLAAALPWAPLSLRRPQGASMTPLQQGKGWATSLLDAHCL